jgi:Lrp/AsnC family leucine-responsive transcriptional regulator
MDKIEAKLLETLQQDGRIPNVQLAEAIGLSESPTFRRVKLLEESGMIRAYVALLDQRKLGLQVTAYVSVRMEKQPDRGRNDFYQRVENEPHIIECHAMSGGFDFLMKVVARDMDHFANSACRRSSTIQAFSMWNHPSVWRPLNPRMRYP